MGIDIVFAILILIMSVVAHEVSHGYAALSFGDPTARLAGRLTLNPAKHLDPVGSLIVPMITMLAGIMVGWAKPVPYNPALFNRERMGTFVVAIAGVVTNLLIALVFALIIRFSGLSIAELLATPFYKLSILIIGINLLLAIFNLLPIPPLDGSKVLFSLLPTSAWRIQRFMEHNWLILIILLLFIAPYIISPLLLISFWLFTGHSPVLLLEALPF